MKQSILYCLCLFLATVAAEAQDFITRGKIEYEVKRNIKRMYADANDDNNRHGNSIDMALPEFDVMYRDLLFSWNRWIYQPGRIGPRPSPYVDESSSYVNLDTKELVIKQRFIDDYMVFEDSLRPIKWQIGQETRKIAGWECRKAIGRIQDSVYVVAFYCPEIIPQGGPELFTGLPGMILGLAIPRLYTTWFATKVEIANIDESKIAPPTVKRNKLYKKKELAELLLKKYKDAGWWQDATFEKVIEMMTRYVLY